MTRFLLPCLGLIVLSACTTILSTNIPGKAEQTLPAEWLGKYEVITPSPLPDKRDSANTEKEFAIIESTRITWKSVDGDKVFSLNDSLKYSVMHGESRYLSLLMPQGLYAVFKVRRNADTLELHSLSADDDIKNPSSINTSTTWRSPERAMMNITKSQSSKRNWMRILKVRSHRRRQQSW
jgi:hypothetical protein